MAKNYMNKFSDYELNRLNTIENHLVRKSTMSIYAYFKKLINREESKELMIPLTKFVRMYGCYHKKVCKTTLMERIKVLEELELLLVRKEPRKTYYKLVVNELKNDDNDDSENKKATDVETEKTTDETEVIEYPPCLETTEVVEGELVGDLECKDSELENILELDIDIYTSSRPAIDLCYENQIEVERKVSCVQLAAARLNTIFKELRVKSKWIKDQALNAVKKNYANITLKYLDSYLIKVVNQKRDLYYTNYQNYVKPVFSKPSTFDHYQQREYSKEQWDEIKQAVTWNTNALTD